MHLLLSHPDKEMYAVGSGMNNGREKNKHFMLLQGKELPSRSIHELRLDKSSSRFFFERDVQ